MKRLFLLGVVAMGAMIDARGFTVRVCPENHFTDQEAAWWTERADRTIVLSNAVTAAQGAQLVRVLPHAAAQPRQRRRAEGGGLHHLRPIHWDTQQVGLHLQQDVRHACSAVGPQQCDVAACVLPHGQHQIRHLRGDALQHRPCDVPPVRAPCDAQYRAPCVHIPVRRAQPRKGRHHHHAAAVRHGRGQRVDLRRGGDDLQLVPQPLYGAAAVKNAALQRVGRLAVHLPRHGAHQPRPASHRRAAHVHQREAPRAVGVFRLAGCKARLPEQRRLLISRRAAHRHARQLLQPRYPRLHEAVYLAVAHGPGQHGHGYAQNTAQLLVPAQPVYVEQHGAAGVGVVRHVHAGELPYQPCLHRAEQDLSPLRPLPQPRHVIQYPADLAAGEIGVDEQPGGGANALLQPLMLQLLAQLRRPAALPHDGVIHRLSRGPVPHDGGLPLVRHADTGDVPLRQMCRSLCGGPPLRVPYLHGVVLHPPRLGIVLAERILRQGQDMPLPVEYDGPRAGCPLIQRQNMVRHNAASFLF